MSSIGRKDKAPRLEPCEVASAFYQTSLSRVWIVAQQSTPRAFCNAFIHENVTNYRRLLMSGYDRWLATSTVSESRGTRIIA